MHNDVWTSDNSGKTVRRQLRAASHRTITRSKRMVFKWLTHKSWPIWSGRKAAINNLTPISRRTVPIWDRWLCPRDCLTCIWFNYYCRMYSVFFLVSRIILTYTVYSSISWLCVGFKLLWLFKKPKSIEEVSAILRKIVIITLLVVRASKPLCLNIL